MNWPTRLFSFRTSATLLLTSALFSLGSCEDPNELGLDLPGTTDLSTEYEDFAVAQAATVLQNGLATTQKDHYIVGRLEDGNTRALVEAKAFLELRPSIDTIPGYFAAQNPRLDSVVMFAGFDQVYGSATAPVRLSVYNLQQPLNESTVYNSSSEIQVAEAIRTDVPVVLNRVIRNKANKADSVLLPLRLVLKQVSEAPTPSVQNLFNLLRTTSSVRLTQPQLQSVWRGLKLESATTGTAIGFNRSPQSEMVIYYHLANPTNPSRRNRTYRIFFNDATPTGSASEPRYFTNIRYDLTGAGAPFAALQGNTAAQVPATSSGGITYAQAGTGLATKLTIPGLDILRARQRQGNVFINRAELIIPVQPFSTGQFGAPPQLYLYEADADNRVLTFTNSAETTERIVRTDPSGNTGRGPEASFAFNLTGINATNQYYGALITSYVQAYTREQLSGVTPAAFLLTASRRGSASLSLNRAAVNADNIRLRVYYSKVLP